MKIVGMLPCKNEAVACAMAVETAKDIVDEIVFVDHASEDGTADIVKRKCAEMGIPLHMFSVPLNSLLVDAIMLAHKEAKKLNPDWLFKMEGDMVFNDQLDVRAIAEAGEYDQYWFRTLNLYGDIKNRRSPGLNIPHLWLFRNKDAPVGYSGVCSVTRMDYPSDPNEDRFLGWNLDGLKYYKHLFERFQLWYVRMWNKRHKTRYGVSEYMNTFFNGPPSDRYMKVFALNRLRVLSRNFEFLVNMPSMKSDLKEFVELYGQYPDILKNWDCPFELMLEPVDGLGLDVIGRKPDLVDVPLLPSSEIYQLKHHGEYRV